MIKYTKSNANSTVGIVYHFIAKKSVNKSNTNLTVQVVHSKKMQKCNVCSKAPAIL